jgi:hypothetical protein
VYFIESPSSWNNCVVSRAGRRFRSGQWRFAAATGAILLPLLFGTKRFATDAGLAGMNDGCERLRDCADRPTVWQVLPGNYVYWEMSPRSPELIYIVTIANRNGLMAIADDEGVAIFTPVRKPMSGGLEHVTFRIDRVQTVTDAWRVIRRTGLVASPSVFAGVRG